MADTFLFFPKRPGLSGTRHFRDLEFSLSANYSRTRGDATPGLSSTDLLTLGNFGETLTYEISNPFNAQYPDLWLIHDYLSATGARYEESELEPYGFTATEPALDPPADRSHIDHYIFEPGLAEVFGGAYTSTFRWQKEDSSTGHWISSTNYEVLDQNSTSFPGPAVGAIQDVTGTGWTRPDASANWGTIHEFQHFFNRGTGIAAMGELFSTAAEDLGAQSDNAALVVTATGSAVASGGDSSGILVQTPAEDGWQTVETFHPRWEADARAVRLGGAARARLFFGSAARVHAVRALAVTERIVPTPLALISANHSTTGDVRTAVASDTEGVSTLARGEEIALGFTATEVPAGRTRLLLLAARGQHRGVERSAGTMATAERPTVPVSYSFALGAARPNPTTGRVTIEYTLASASDAKLRVYDVTGRLVRTLVDGMKEAGPHEAVWDGRTGAGAKAGLGVYFYRLEAGALRSERKVVVIRE